MCANLRYKTTLIILNLNPYYFIVITDFCYDNPCGNRGICLDVGDRYRCVCNPGYKGEQCQG